MPARTTARPKSKPKPKPKVKVTKPKPKPKPKPKCSGATSAGGAQPRELTAGGYSR